MHKSVICKDVDGKTHEVPSENLNWRPSAYGIVVKDDAILLSKQFGKYDLPGGGIELGETPEEAVAREVKEETGIDIAKPEFIGLENSFFLWRGAENRAYQTLLLYFVCSPIGGTLSTAGFDEEEKSYAELAEWVPLTKLDELQIASTVDYRPYIRTALAR